MNHDDVDPGGLLRISARGDLAQLSVTGAAVRVVLVEAGDPGPGSAQLAELTAALAHPQLISIGHAGGDVDAASAAAVLACDFVVCSPDSQWHTAAEQVAAAARRRLPAALAATVIAAGRWSGSDLHGAGLVTELSADPAQAAEALAVELLAVPAGSLSGSKEMIDSAASTDLDTALALESRLQIAALLSDDHQRIVRDQAAARAERPASPQT
jgi:enoyl-CoA hydratase/carnithine racemase